MSLKDCKHLVAFYNLLETIQLNYLFITKALVSNTVKMEKRVLHVDLSGARNFFFAAAPKSFSSELECCYWKKLVWSPERGLFGG